MGNTKIFIWLQINSFTIYISVSETSKKNFRTMLKFIYPLSFLLWRTKKIKWNWRKFWQLVLQTYSYPFLFTNLHFSLEKKLFQRSLVTLVLIIFLQTNPKMLDANRMICKSILYSSFLAAILKQGLIKAPYHSGAPDVNFWRISVRKTIWDLEFSKHLL